MDKEELKKKFKEEIEKKNIEIDKQKEKIEIASYNAKLAIIKAKTTKYGKVFNIFSSILLIISYLLFGIATILFINTCINFNKISTDDPENIMMKDKDKDITKKIFSKLINKPIFEYLKPINILFIDDFFLNNNGKVFLVFICIFGFSLIMVIGIIIYWLRNEDKMFNYMKNDIVYKYTFIIKVLPYIFIFIIFTYYNNNTNKNIKLILEDNSIIDQLYKKNIIEFNIKNSQFLKKLKNIIIRYIYNDIEYNIDNISKELLNKLGGVMIIDDTQIPTPIDINFITKNLTNNNEIGKISIIQAIFEIYKLDYKDDNEKTKFISYIDDYFNILINNKNIDTNYYTKYYLFGLIKDRVNSPLNIKLLIIKDNLNSELTKISIIIRNYYISIIVLYVILLLIIFSINFNFIIKYILEFLFMYKISFLRVTFSLIIIILIYIIIFVKK
jgi:hypothetical protein